MAGGLIDIVKQVVRTQLDNMAHVIPSIKYGVVTAVSPDGTASVRLDGETTPTGSISSLARVKVGNRVQMVLFNRRLVILGAIQRTDKLDADTLGGVSASYHMRYPPGKNPGVPTAGFDANTVDRGKPSMIPLYSGVNTPSKAIAVLETVPYSNDWVVQYFHEIGSANRQYRRSYHSGTTWSAWELVTPEDYQTHDEYLRTTTNSHSIQIGSLNTSFCHYQTTAPRHYFNTDVAVQGEIRAGSGYNKLVWHDGNVTYHGNASNGAVRYPNGVQIAWLAITTNTALTLPYGAAAFQATYTWTFAAAFSSTPAVSCGRFQHTNTASWGMAAWGSLDENKYALLRGMDFYSREAGSTAISATAVGRWK